MRTVSSYNYKKFFISATAVCALGSGLLLASAQQAHAQLGLVISQFYGGAGSASPTFGRDFIEIFNGSSTAINLTGYTIQYATANSTVSPLPAGNINALTFTGANTTIASGGFFLIGAATGNAGSSTLPTLDATITADLAGSNGQIFLASNNTGVTSVSGSNSSATLSSNVVDFVGYGTAVRYEGAGAAPAPSATNSGLRKSSTSNFIDSNSNVADFTAVVANSAGPRNSASANPFGANFVPADTPEPGTFALGLTALPVLCGIGLRRRALGRKAHAAHA